MLKKKILIILAIAIFTILYIFLFRIYIKENNQDTDTSSNIKTVQTDTVTLDKVINFIDEYDINYLDAFGVTFTNSNNIINQVKLKYVYYAIKENADFTSGVSYTRFGNYLKAVFGSKITFKNEDILSNTEDQKIFIKYNIDNEAYLYSDLNDTDLGTIYYSRYNYIVSYKNSNGIYKLIVNKFFLKNDKVYPSLGDLNNDINVLFTIPSNTANKDDYIKNYVDVNYSSLKSKMIKYTYTFVKQNSALILKKLEKEA